MLVLQTMPPDSGFRIAPNWPWIGKTTITSQFVDMTSPSNCFDIVLFLLSNFVTGPSFMLISSLVLELWQFSFIGDFTEIWKPEIPPSEFWPMSGDWGKLGIPQLVGMCIMQCYWILKNARVTVFIVSEFLREKQQGSKITLTQIRVKTLTNTVQNYGMKL